MLIIIQMDTLKQLFGKDIANIINEMMFPCEIFGKVLDDIKEPYVCYLHNCHFSTTKINELDTHIITDEHRKNEKKYISCSNYIKTHKKDVKIEKLTEKQILNIINIQRIYEKIKRHKIERFIKKYDIDLLKYKNSPTICDNDCIYDDDCNCYESYEEGEKCDCHDEIETKNKIVLYNDILYDKNPIIGRTSLYICYFKEDQFTDLGYETP